MMSPPGVAEVGRGWLGALGRVPVGPVAVGAAMLLLAVRLVHDVGAKPYFEDEAVAGLIASRPIGELLRTVVWDRGGSPLHFLLAHAVFSIAPTVGALRWLSFACALGTVVCAYALGRELCGEAAGVAAAWVAAASGLLGVYGTFGRMYSLLALVGGLNMLFFLRALELPTPRRGWLAAASAWLLAATHPFAVVPVAAEAAVGLFLWRGRGWRLAVPAVVAAVAYLPLAVGEARLVERFHVSASSGATMGSGGTAETQLRSALQGFAGGRGPALWLFVGLAVLGAWIVFRRSPLFMIVGASALLVPPALSLLARVRNPDTAFLSARHLIAALPLWAALIGTGAASLARAWRRDRLVSALAAAAVAALAVGAPATAHDPRTGSRFWATTGDVHTADAVATWLGPRIQSGDLLFPYAAPFLRALPEARKARALPHGDARTLLATIGDPGTVPALWITLPLGPGDRLRPGAVRSLRRSYQVAVFPHWLVLRVPGPFSSRREVVAMLARAVDAASTRVVASGRVSRAYEQLTRTVVDDADRDEHDGSAR